MQVSLPKATQSFDIKENYERAGDATTTARHFPFPKQGFHPPGIVGPLGSALAAAVWLQLDDSQTAMALGIASSGSDGLAGNI